MYSSKIRILLEAAGSINENEEMDEKCFGIWEFAILYILDKLEWSYGSFVGKIH